MSGIGLIIVPGVLEVAASVWPDKVKPHPYWLLGFGVFGLILFVVPLLRRIFKPKKASAQPGATANIAIDNRIAGNNTGTNIGNVQGNLHLDQSTHTTTYGVAKPPPKLIDITVQAIAATPEPMFPIPQEQMAEFRRKAMSAEPHTWTPGVSVSFRVAAPLSSPMFKLRCDHGCLVTNIMFADHRSSQGSGVQTIPTNDPCIVIAGPKLSTLLTPNLRVEITLRAQIDEPLNLLTVEAFVL